jgi:Tol biopolymer transport system component/DNA-binding winged helix-turn-helix (wHTH) protein
MKRQIYKFGDFRLDTANRRLLRAGTPVTLPARAFDLLQTLLENNGRLVEKDELFANVWRDQIVEESNLTVHISQIRKALGESKNKPRFIETVSGYGYRFVGDVSDEDDEEFVIETATISHITVEKTEENGSRGESKKLETSKFFFSKITAVIAAISLLVIIGFWGFAKFRGGLFSASAVEKQPKIKKLTNNGKVSNAVLSPDGRFFAYAVSDKPNWQTSIRLGQTDGGSDVVLRPTADVIYRVTAFSADGAWLYYAAGHPRQLSSATLYKMPVLGGAAQKLADGVSVYSSLSPDEKQIAYVRNDTENKISTLVIADTDGSNQREIATRPIDKLFFPGSSAWSTDGSLVAVAAANNFNNSDVVNQNFEIFTVSVADGRLKQLTTLEWSSIVSLEWLKDSNGLAVVGRDKESGFRDSLRRSVWLVDYPAGTARKITVDLNTHANSLSLTSDAKTILAVQGQSESNIWIADTENPAAARQVTFGSAGRIDGWYGLDWTPDGQIIYTAWTDRNSTIWMMNADGTNARQLTPIGFWDEKPTVTSDGKFIIFQSNRSGNPEIWRMNIDGSDPQQLTKGEGINSQPSITPDGNWIFYMNERGGEMHVRRVAVEGGENLQLTAARESSFPRVSPDGKFVACGFETNGKMQLAVFSATGGEPVKLFDVPQTYNFYNSIRWTPDGKFITYRDWANGIWQQSIEGGAPERLKGLPEEKLVTYGWSPDGKKLAFTRYKEILDAVLITDFR